MLLPLISVNIFSFGSESELEQCYQLAKEFDSIANVRQRMFKPYYHEWDPPNEPQFPTPTVYWIQRWANLIERDKGHSLDSKMDQISEKAQWSSCFDGIILYGDMQEGPITLGSINNYFPNPKDYEENYEEAMNIRLRVCKMQEKADAFPPYIVLPIGIEKTQPIGFLACYEFKDKEQEEEGHNRTIDNKAIVDEIEKIAPFLAHFARMRSNVVYGQDESENNPVNDESENNPVNRSWTSSFLSIFL